MIHAWACAALTGMLALSAAAKAPALDEAKATVNDETTSEINDASSVADLSGVWFFQKGDNPMFARPAFDDRDWAPLRVPTDRVSLDRRWKGFGWYRRHVYVGSRVLGNDLMLSLGPAREVVEVYVNGTLLMQRGRFGSRLHGAAHVPPLQALLPQGVLRAGENVIAVRVYDPAYTCGLPAGPFLLGPPDVVQERTWQGGWALLLRLSLALVAICIALGQVLVYAGHSRSAGDPWWAGGAALCLAVVHMAGTGVLSSTLPSLDLATRLPPTAQALSLLCLFNYFAAHYDDFDRRRARLGRFILGSSAAFIFLAPDTSVFLAANPMCLLYALMTTLYAAHLLAQAARRQEAGSLVVFAALLGSMAVLVYDGLVPKPSDALPSFSAMGGVLLLGLITVQSARQANREHEMALVSSMRLRKQIDGRVWMDILVATASAITRPQEFLEAVAHEITRELEVRRCSIILPDTHGNLFIAACKGLPRQARLSAIQTNRSIAHYVFERGQILTPSTLPDSLAKSPEKSRQSNYETNGFIAQPIRMGQRTLGVLSVSDRNNGGFFSSDDETRMAQLADRLALVLHRLDLRLDAILALSPAVQEVRPALIKVESEPKGRAIGQVAGEPAPSPQAPADAMPGAEGGEDKARVVVSKNLS